MMTIATLVAAIVFVAVFRVPLKKVPWLFYLVAIAVDALVILCPQMSLPLWLFPWLITPNVRCLFAFALFTIVMVTGALRHGSTLRRALAPIRAELSIFAALLVVGHVVRYLSVYSLRVLQNPASLKNGMLVSFVVSVVIAVLLVVLTVTSFSLVKRHMGGRAWKIVQRLAYPFFALIYVHVLFMLARSAMSGGPDAIASIAVYGVILLVYAVLRVRRYLEDKQAQRAPAEKATAE